MSGITHLAGSGAALDGLPPEFQEQLAMQNMPVANINQDFSVAVNPVAKQQFDMSLEV
mgnify:CR=1 FL=1